MKLISLSLKNFRQHRDSKIEFADGLTGIIGNNGAGKSTVVEALAFALYGSRALRGKVDEVRTFGLPANSITSAELVFHSEGLVYRIYRDLGNAELYLGGQSEYLVSGNKAVAERVTEILGLSLDEFLASYYTEQKSLEFLSGKKGTAEREKFITRMIGYDRLEKVQILLREERRDLRILVSGLAASLADPKLLEERIQREEFSWKTLKAQEQEAIKVLAQADQSNKIVQDEFKKMELVHLEFQKLKQELAILHNSERLVKEREELLKANNLQLLNSLHILHGAEYNFDHFGQELSRLEIEQSTVSQQIVSLEKELLEIRKQRQDQLSIEQSNLAVANNQESLVQKKLVAIKKLQTGGECPTCGQLLGSEFQIVANQLASELTLIVETQEKIKRAIYMIQAESDSEKILIQQISEQRAQLEQVTNRLVIIRGSQQEVIKLQSNQQELLKLQKDLEGYQQRQLMLQTKQDKLNYSENSYLGVKADTDNRVALLSAARLQKVRNEGELREVEAMLTRTKAELLEYQQKNSEVNVRRQELQTLDQSDQILSDFRKHLNSSIRPRLAELASAFLTDLSDGRYSNVLIAEDFSPLVYEDGTIKNILSGGEEDLLDLCLRLALSSLITERAGQNLSFLILDEVFGSLDESRRFNVLTLLEKLQNRFEQILLITHLDDVKDGVANLLEINYDESSGKIEIIKDRYQEIL